VAFTGVDSMVTSRASGKFQRIPFNKTVVTGATSAAGRWHELLSGGGTGGSMVLTGSAGVGSARDRLSAGALPLGADVATDIRHFLSMTGITGGATLTPGLLLLTDILHVYTSCVLTGTPSTMSAHPTWTGTGDTRMTNANGVQCSLIVTTAGTAGNGQLSITYTDQGGSAGNASGAMYAPATNAPAGCLYGQTNTAVTVGGPYFPLAAGDNGVQSIQSYTIATGLTTGVGAFVLHRPIAEIPLAATNTAGMIADIIGDRIFDNACLGMLMQIGGAATAGQQVTGSILTSWG
jgi:energy-converting hydrogenase Eha subunit C